MNLELIGYGLSQAKGQLRIIREARPISEVLKDPHFPDSLKTNLRKIEAIKSFAFDSLGINFSKNYSSVFDQKGRPSMFVVTACDPFMLNPKKWHFPILGSFSYKGFFEIEKARKLEAELKEEGFDTNIRIAGGWSTLGWFEDPILSNMLSDSEAEFAETIIHELTHGTLFVKDSLQFNENLATFIGIKGSELYLSNQYGTDNPELKDYRRLRSDRNLITKHILAGALYLDSLYQEMSSELDLKTKQELKDQAISQIISTLDTLNIKNAQKIQKYYEENRPNNTLFMSYLRYRAYLDLLEEEWSNKYNRDIKMMLNEYKSKYPSL